MTAERGWVEPVDASESPAQHDDLEHWLQGIRTDLAGDPADWLDTSAAADDAEALPLVDDDGDDSDGDDGDDDGGDPAPQPRPAQIIGRHRAED